MNIGRLLKNPRLLVAMLVASIAGLIAGLLVMKFMGLPTALD